MAESPIQTNLREDMIDMVIISRRGAQYVSRVLLEAAENPEEWIRHQFIVIFDDLSDEHVAEMDSWYKQQKEQNSLPNMALANVSGYPGNLNVLRQKGVELGSSPYLYFQDDDDPLPTGMPRRVELMKRENWDAVFGITQTINSRGHQVEKFPPITPDGRFIFDPLEASKWFPTYPHPSAALFRRKLLEEVPYSDGNKYRVAGNAAYLVHILNENRKITFLPDVIRLVRHHDDNSTGSILPTEQRMGLSEDIRAWLKYIKNEEVRLFHEDVSEALASGEITTFKEIDSMVEARLEDIAQGISERA